MHERVFCFHLKWQKNAMSCPFVTIFLNNQSTLKDGVKRVDFSMSHFKCFFFNRKLKSYRSQNSKTSIEKLGLGEPQKDQEHKCFQPVDSRACLKHTHTEKTKYSWPAVAIWLTFIKQTCSCTYPWRCSVRGEAVLAS